MIIKMNYGRGENPQYDLMKGVYLLKMPALEKGQILVTHNDQGITEKEHASRYNPEEKFVLCRVVPRSLENDGYVVRFKLNA
jgi:hypothetical protein